MKLGKIINLLGEILGCNYIIRRVLEPHSTFKGFVLCTIELYSIQDKPILILSVDKVLHPQRKEQDIEVLEEEFIKKVFNYVLQ